MVIGVVKMAAAMVLSAELALSSGAAAYQTTFSKVMTEEVLETVEEESEEAVEAETEEAVEAETEETAEAETEETAEAETEETAEAETEEAVEAETEEAAEETEEAVEAETEEAAETETEEAVEAETEEAAETETEETVEAETEETAAVAEPAEEETEADGHEAIPVEEINYEADTIASGVYLYGRSLSGMTYDEACSFADELMNKYYKRKITVTSKFGKVRGSLKNFGAKISDDQLKEELLSLVLTDESAVERFRLSLAISEEPVDLTFDVTGLKKKNINAYFTERTADWSSQPVNATATCRTGEYTIIPSVDGYSYEFSGTAKKIKAAVTSGKYFEMEEAYKIKAKPITVAPTYTTEMFEQFSVIGSFTTFYQAPTTTILSNRQQNLIVSSSNINGRIFAPGERISALTMYGDVTAANGFMPALTILGGAHYESIGGGICQTTTTLYNAVLYAELEVIYRSNHSMVSNYVPASRDAMVYYDGWDHQSNMYDFVFRNSTSDYLLIDAYVDPANCSITVNLIGREEHDPGRVVDFESEVTGWIAPAINHVVDPNLVNTYEPYATIYYQIGENSPEPGLYSRLWKLVYQDGVLISRELVTAQDYYKPQVSTFGVAPGVRLYCTQGPDYHTCYIIINADH